MTSFVQKTCEKDVVGIVKFVPDWLTSYQSHYCLYFILLHEKLLQFDWLRAVIFQLNLKYLHVKITNLLRVVV